MPRCSSSSSYPLIFAPVWFSMVFKKFAPLLLRSLAFHFIFLISIFDDFVILSASKILKKKKKSIAYETRSLNSNSTFEVVCDLHRQLHDLLFLLKYASFPTQNHIFIFNGITLTEELRDFLALANFLYNVT